ncbi:Caspase, interleukin-1 beta converting enzyme (ICE) ues [Desmophyllum pertusum]|uniref:Caspase, interleukin-1 beta converting enzyme (ICE) ues n=1 Tax=Desmophyllum pertusum TaxID=174260 RepID=A0A9X0A4F7_9CNID|nr:Caspase, interleukin-1 beta converting enzyme (ICE) ues [Desmophyllum pertusum]
MGLRKPFQMQGLETEESGLPQNEETACGPLPACALISLKSAKIVDGRIYLTTRQDEECNLSNNCRKIKPSNVEEVPLEVQIPLTEIDVGSVILISFGSTPTMYQRYQAVCECIYLLVPQSSTDGVMAKTPPLKSYKMRSNPRGKCIILNNVSFHNKANDRCGAELDEDVLEDVFKELDFDVLVRRDLTRNEMQKFTEEVAGQDHSVFDAFVYVIMSHGGNRDIIYGVDGKTIRIEDLMSEFIARKLSFTSKQAKAVFHTGL